MERILIKFTKVKGAKFISHLDTMRTLHRALRRAGLPVAYSKGFNPHASISVAAPLSLGIASTAEYADIELNECIKPEVIREKLNMALPEGIQVLNVLNIGEKMPTSMGIVDGAKYVIKQQHNASIQEIESTINEVIALKEIFKNKRTKSGEKLVDIRPLIRDIKLINYEKDHIEMECVLLAGSKGSLGPEMISELIKEKSNNKIYGYPEIERKEIYCLSNNKWIDLLAYFSGK